MIAATMPIDAPQRRAALAVVATLFCAALAGLPFAHIQLTRVDAFIPVLQSVLCVIDLVTAILLFAQYSIQPRLALLVLASGYLAGGLFAFLQTLAFPGAYAPAGLIGNGIDSPGWFFVWWNVTFPATVLLYALLKEKSGEASYPGKSVAVTIGATIGFALLFVAALTLLATKGIAYLPGLYVGGITQQTSFASQINLAMWCWNAVVVTILFLRRRTILDLWLVVTLLAWMPNFLIAAAVSAVRFSVGWYTARGFVLIASSTLLIVLLTETIMLYARLVDGMAVLRRERSNRLMSLHAATSAMAHEIRQPLTVIEAEGSAAEIWLEQTPPKIAELKASIASILASAGRTERIISSIQALFKNQISRKERISINSVVREALRMTDHDLRSNGVSTRVTLQRAFANIDRVQLQQVIVNLIRNAIDAMAAVPRDSRVLGVSTKIEGKLTVLLTVEDAGPGIPAAHQKILLDPFFTTKPGGMGLGLAISQMIVEAHGGKLRLASTGPAGSAFEVSLPLASSRVS